MKKTFLLTAVAFATAPQFIQAQSVKIGSNPATINTNSILELESTNQGLLLPRVALTGTANTAPLTAHVAGMTVYNTASAGNVTPGFYFNDGTKWVRVAATNNVWSLTGNAGTVAGTNFLGTTDNVDLLFKRNDSVAGLVSTNNVALGYNALKLGTTTGLGNVAIGTDALRTSTVSNLNTAVGWNALKKNTASGHTAVGFQALAENTTGGFNAAFGQGTMRSNTTGKNNTALGEAAMEQNTTGDFGTAVGTNAMQNFNTFGEYNSALGENALRFMTSGSNNTVIGASSMYSFTSGSRNVTLGQAAGVGLTSGNDNIFLGNGVAPNVSATASSQMNIGNKVFADSNKVGILAAMPKSTFEVNGSVGNNIRVVTGSAVLGINDYTVIATPAAAGNSFTLPDAATCKGRIYAILNYGSVPMAVSPGFSTATTQTTISAGEKLTLQSDGAKWWSIGQ